MSTPHSQARPQPGLKRLTSSVTAIALALGAVLAFSSPAAASPSSQPVPEGVYLDSSWVAPGGEITLIVVGYDGSCGVGSDVDSVNFVHSGGTTPLEPWGLGFGLASYRDYALRDGETGNPLPLGSTSPVSGNVVVTCIPIGGGSAVEFSMPLLVSKTRPASIYHSPTQWTWYTPGDLSTGAEVTVNALGFEPGETATVNLVNDTVYWDSDGTDLAGSVAAPVTVVADGEGAVTAQVTIPAGWTSGDMLDAYVAGASSRYLLISGEGTPQFGDPSIDLSSTGSAFPGGAVSVHAGGFDPGETVTVALHSASSPAVPMATLTANSSGVIAASVYLPAGVSPGSYRVWAGAKKLNYLTLNAPLTIGSAPATDRVSGINRYETAAATAQRFAPFAPDSGTVYLASGQTFPDALGAGALAAQVEGPVLLTDPNGLSASIIDELVRLHPAHVKIVGGTSVVSVAVFNAVEALPFEHDTIRLGGADRYETNRLTVADALSSATTVYIAAGSNFPDALAAGPAAATLDGAVLLVNGAASSLNQPTLDLLESLGVTSVRLVGGTGILSAGIEAQLKALYPGNVVRFGGADRYETASQIVAGAWSSTSSEVILASGANFPDALAAGALGIPMLTSRPTCIPAVVLAQLGELEPTTLTLVGGTGSLSNGVKNFVHC